jgi:hypothetical protein
MPSNTPHIKQVTIIVEADTLRLLQQQLRVLGCTYCRRSGWHVGPYNLSVGIFCSPIDGKWFTQITNVMHLEIEAAKEIEAMELAEFGPPAFEYLPWDSKPNPIEDATQQ